jgi:hypothetical protein
MALVRLNGQVMGDAARPQRKTGARRRQSGALTVRSISAIAAAGLSTL